MNMLCFDEIATFNLKETMKKLSLPMRFKQTKLRKYTPFNEARLIKNFEFIYDGYEYKVRKGHLCSSFGLPVDRETLLNFIKANPMIEIITKSKAFQNVHALSTQTGIFNKLFANGGK